jgi:hypothetical protein
VASRWEKQSRFFQGCELSFSDLQGIDDTAGRFCSTQPEMGTLFRIVGVFHLV